MKKFSLRPNTYTVENNTAIINLSQGKKAIIDKDDLDRVIKYRWYSLKVKNYAKETYIAVSQIWVNEKRVMFTLQRFILNIDKPKSVVDHINGNTLDNRKENLREVSYSLNTVNSGIRKNNKSGFKGVHFSKEKNTWVAQISKDYKKIIIGFFDTPIEAAKAYDKKAIELFGNHCKTNFPSELI